MKEIISAVLLVVSLFSGTQLLKGFHEVVQRAALEKAAQGLPSLEKMSRVLSARPTRPVRGSVKRSD